jgi:hypothetical protein
MRIWVRGGANEPLSAAKRNLFSFPQGLPRTTWYRDPIFR